MTEMTLDTMDKRILDIIQTDFPLESRPYAIIAERLGITEQEALDRVNALRKSRLTRRLGGQLPVGQTRFPLHAVRGQGSGGQAGCLHSRSEPACGRDAQLFAPAMPTTSGFPQSAPRGRPCAPMLDDITAKTGIPILNLPATKLYKIRVDFQMEE